MEVQSLLGLSLLILALGKVTECENLAKQYFLTLDYTYTKGGLTMQEIDDKLCMPKKVGSQTVSCFLKYKVVGEPRIIVVVDVTNSSEFERRTSSFTRSQRLQYESEPVIAYGDFARYLGVNETLTNTSNFETNTLENVTEVLWCEFNINFGDKTATESLDIWRLEAELLMITRNTGIPLEAFKTLGERTVHLLILFSASTFDHLLFSTPFNQRIANTLTTTCKVVVNT